MCETVVNSQDLLDFIANLNTTSCLQIQVNVNKFLQDKVPAHTVFCVCLLEDCEEAIIQVVGGIILNNNLRFTVPHEIVKLITQNDKKGQNEMQVILDNVLKDTTIHVLSGLQYLNICHPCKEDQSSFIVCLESHVELEDEHMDFVRMCFRYCNSFLINAVNAQEDRRMKEQCQKLMSIAKNLFLHLGDLDELLKEIMIEARQLTQAERCSLFLLSDDGTELLAKMLDGAAAHEAKELRISVTQGIAGRVAATGTTLNIRDVYSHPLFYKGVDETTGFKTRNILCFAIKNHKGKVVGVAELCNKKSGFYFDRLDEQAAEAFSAYCGISIMQGVMYKKIQLSQARSRLSNELLMYHMQVSNDDVEKTLTCKTQHDYTVMDDVLWASRLLSDADTPCYTMRMFEALGLMEMWRIRHSTLARFILLVRKGYRDIPYHNWMHAFSVTHMAYHLVKHVGLLADNLITSLEAVALLVSCLCHDLDHRGTTSSFQTKSRNTLACLYSSEGSVMERHHLAQALCILNTQDCNIFENLTCEEYTHVLDLIRNLILATDLAQHLRLLTGTRTMCQQGYNPRNHQHRTMLLSLIMTCCDLNDQVKGWQYSINIAEMIYNEFFIQGDMEKAMGSVPAVMMDRDLADIPSLQVDFLQDICIPCFSLLADIFPVMSGCVAAMENSLQCWKKAVPWFRQHRQPESCCIELLRDSDFISYVLHN